MATPGDRLGGKGRDVRARCANHYFEMGGMPYIAFLVDMISVDPGAQAQRRGRGKQQGLYTLRSWD